MSTGRPISFSHLSAPDLLAERERFITKYAPRDPNQRCWDGGGCGYRTCQVLGVWFSTHRVAVALFHGPLLRGAVVRHLCNNPGCVNPVHLVAGTQQENVWDQFMGGQKSGHRNKVAHQVVLTNRVNALVRQERKRWSTASLLGGVLTGSIRIQSAPNEDDASSSGRTISFKILPDADDQLREFLATRRLTLGDYIHEIVAGRAPPLRNVAGVGTTPDRPAHIWVAPPPDPPPLGWAISQDEGVGIANPESITRDPETGAFYLAPIGTDPNPTEE